MTKIRISFPDGIQIETFEYDDDFGAPIYHAQKIMEDLFPEDAEAGTIYSDGDRWYTEDGAEAKWYEE